MNENLKKIQDLFQKKTDLNEQDKETLIKAIADADKQWAITEFKLERTEKVKRTTAILLEETIEELEQKRKAVELQNHELEIESSLERVRTVAMSMNRPDDMLHVCQTIAEQLQLLKVKEIRNVQTAIFYKDKGTYMNYEYYAKHNKTFITETTYTNHEIHEDFANKMLKGNGEFMVAHIKGDEVRAWVDYQKTTNVFIDDYLYTASSLNYYWFSLGPVALGISTYVPLTEEETNLFKRFLKVFELSYRRYLDIEKAEAQAHEAKVEASLEKVRAVAMSMNKPDDLLNICETLYKEFSAFGFANVRNAMINIHDDEKKTFVNYDYSDEIGKSTNHLQYDLHPVIKKQIKQIRTANDAFSETVFTGKNLVEWKKFRKKIGEKDDPRIKKAKALYYYFYSIGTGSIGISTFSIVNEKNLKLLKRFRNVFNLSYQRYTDLALAEAQAKEAKIEAALERVRAQAMSLRKSEELAGVGQIIFEQLKQLGFSDLRNTEIIINNDAKESILSYYYSDYGITGNIEVFYKTNPTIQVWVNELKKANDAFAAIEISENEMNAWRKYREEIGYMSDPKLNEAKNVFYYSYSTGLGALSISSFTKISDEQIKTLERFRNVFGLAYRRYADVAQAEAQAREAQIELALERVRARTMAMQKSDELAETASVLFKQLVDLGIKPAQMRTCAITTLKPDEPIGECWITSPDGEIIPQSFMVPYDETSAYKTIYAAWKNGEKFLVVNLSGDALLQHLNFLKKYAKIPTQQFQALPDQPKETFTHAMFFSQGYLFIISNEPLLEYHDIFKRFGAIFQQTYTRFLDLKKAEDQARESQIQLALERVRARTMAMQKSDELSETVFILFQQFKQLGENPDQATIGIINEEEWVIEYWVTMYGNQTNRVYKFPIDEPNVTNRIYKAWKEQKKSLVIELTGKELYDFANFRESMGGAAYNEKEKKRVINVAFFSKGIINVQSDEARSEESIRLLERFAGVFEQTYTRFLDLQKAETQARESQIEASLERVRSRSMAMQKSEELKEVIQVVYDQFVHLNMQVEHTGFIMDYKERDDMHIWLADAHAVPSEISIPYFDSPHWNSFIEAKEKGIDFFANLLNFEEKNKFYQDLFKLIPGVPEETLEYYSSCPGLAGSTVLLDNIGLYIENFSGIPYTGEENNTLMRFGKVFQQTYTRFLDLQRAEAQALEAIKRASVDRVRAEIASMRTTNDLERITPLIWNELTVLGIPFIRCGVFIMDEEQQQVQTFLYTEGKTIASFTSTFSNSKIITEALPFWRRKEIFKTHWDEAAFLEQAKSLVEQGAIITGEKYLTEHRPTDLYLHFLPFLQGMLYVGDAAPLSEEHLQLVQALAEAFSTAYARYEDFNKLEAAKQQVDKTLVDLKQTQTQLIQSEKMASLGELTAGIAHEIQNPLNFVNNFSEVNKELLTEMKDEIEKGNLHEAKEIANDIISNEEKINHHGKRADAIVKGMLQHSRSSTNVKEPTDINKLTDEYLRLAYHGLRAKDKSFNAALITDYDESIGNINIIPQDVGRVLLNLYTNAFYAVSEKQKTESKEYEPTVSISTKRINNKTEITVKDNGNGIPQKILDKIFQPFFTTKPTGQGTGLGLSLSYDIIKAHNSEIKVETKEGEGTTFIVQLSIF
jgi:signal transduction histidine kinase